MWRGSDGLEGPYSTTFCDLVSDSDAFSYPLDDLLKLQALLCGIAFWNIARSLRHTSMVRDYMSTSAYGLLLLFVSDLGE